ncbi:hypothetical protein R3I93_020008 [Phoxinus phoxinus]|uniref:Uncharacterized protein n=1 Tax=Phoxinus phoxinus TaxID=58324 RepID=A0AAN9CB41_9TELE
MVLVSSVWVLVLLVSVQCLSRDQLFDYGIRFGDRILGSGTDSVRELELEQPLYFFKGNFRKIYWELVGRIVPVVAIRLKNYFMSRDEKHKLLETEFWRISSSGDRSAFV